MEDFELDRSTSKDKICDECGSEMKVVVKKKATFKSRKIGHYECSCGFKKTYESLSEWEKRMNNEYADHLEEQGIDLPDDF